MSIAKGGGGCLVLMGFAFFCLAVFMFADPLEGETRLQSLVPGLFFGAVTFFPADDLRREAGLSIRGFLLTDLLGEEPPR